MSSFLSDISPSWPSNAYFARYCSTSGSGGGGGGAACRDGGGGGARDAEEAAAGVDFAAGGLRAGVAADLPGRGCAAGFGREAAGFFCETKSGSERMIKNGGCAYICGAAFPKKLALGDGSHNAGFRLRYGT